MITDRQVIDFLTNVSKHGGEIIITPHDWLNPACGYAASLKLPANTETGYSEVNASGDDGILALRQLIRSISPIT